MSRASSLSIVCVDSEKWSDAVVRLDLMEGHAQQKVTD